MTAEDFMRDLVAQRVRAGLLQSDVARHLEVSQGRVAKIEASPQGVALSQVLGYAEAVGILIQLKATEPKAVSARVRIARSKNAPRVRRPSA